VVVSELSSVPVHAVRILFSQLSSTDSQTRTRVEGKTRSNEEIRERNWKEEEERGGKEGKRTNLHK
jgi:hypothetical protein